MTYKSETGKYGEDLACEYLKDKGYKIIERNYRKKWGELDIISKDPKGVLVFVEVKALRCNSGQVMRSRHKVGIPTSLSKVNNEASGQFGNNAASSSQDAATDDLLPEENLTAAKLRKLKRTASLYVGSHQELINDKKGWRIDLVAIQIFDNGDHEIKHFENIEYE